MLSLQVHVRYTHAHVSVLRKAYLSQYMSHLFECRDVQIDFFIHLWSSRPSLTLHLSYFSSSPSPSNKHRHFIDTGPDAAILFLTLCYVLITGSPVYRHGVDAYRWIHAHTLSHTHELRGTCTHGLSFGQEIFVTATLLWKRRCVYVCMGHSAIDVWLLIPCHLIITPPFYMEAPRCCCMFLCIVELLRQRLHR